MSRTIFLHNKSNHNQTFEVHGINNNRNITVGAHQTARLLAPDHSSGAIIALHDSHEGEQAEFTKNGFQGNDFIDLSNIVGAGGNMTVAQTDDFSTTKGDPNFMQDFNRAWKKASQDTKKSLMNCVHLDRAGKVIRIDAIKSFPKLEKFVRSFADGMTYIGEGSWGGHPGNPKDDQQSSAAKGNKDLIVTYSDGNAMPVPVHRTALSLNSFLANPPPPASKADSTRPAVYEIVPEDTFESLAQRYGLTVTEIESINPGIDSTKLQPGGSIRLVPEHLPSAYTIGDSDNYRDLAEFFGIPQENIVAANPGVDLENLKVGQVINLIIPEGEPNTEVPVNGEEHHLFNGEESQPLDGEESLPVHEGESQPFHEGEPQPVDGDESKSSLHIEEVKALKGSGIILSNKSHAVCTYYFYNNLKNDGVFSVPNFTKPFTTVTIKGNHTTFVPLPSSFKGRVQRGAKIPATWAEFQLDASNDHAAHGDISVEQGNDGGARIASTDGHKSVQGFTASSGDIQTWGSPEAYQTRADGVRALASTMGNWLGGPNQAAIKAQKERIGKTAYVTGGTGIPDVASRNHRLIVEFY